MPHHPRKEHLNRSYHTDRTSRYIAGVRTPPRKPQKFNSPLVSPIYTQGKDPLSKEEQRKRRQKRIDKQRRAKAQAKAEKNRKRNPAPARHFTPTAKQRKELQRAADERDDKLREILERFASAEKLPINRTQQRYADYIRSEKWSMFRLSVFAQRGRQCECCGSVNLVQIHHLTYDRLGNEAPRDVVVLCDGCHTRIHALMC